MPSDDILDLFIPELSMCVDLLEFSLGRIPHVQNHLYIANCRRVDSLFNDGLDPPVLLGGLLLIHFQVAASLICHSNLLLRTSHL